MSGPIAQVEEASSASPEDAVEVGVYPEAGSAAQRGLVVLAMGLGYWLRQNETGGWSLIVEGARAEEVLHQLALFERESVDWPPRPPPARPRVSGALVTPCLWAAAVVWVFWQQTRMPGALESAGALDPAALFTRGEWWRPVTSLFLHADIGHLVSNVVAGLIVFAAMLNTCGLLRGWLSLAAAAIAGNVFAAAIQSGEAYRAIGASTAVFAGIGILTGAAVRSAIAGRSDGLRRRGGLRAIFIPLAAGLILLGWLGAGGWRTDVIAHATGFVAGVVAGLFVKPLERGGAR